MLIFIVLGDGQAMLGMSDIEILNILSVKCSTLEPSGHMREIDEQRIGEKTCANTNSNDS